MSGFEAPQPPPPEPPPPGPPPPGPGPSPEPAGSGAAPAEAGGQRQLVGFLVSFQDEPAGRFWPLYKGRNSVGRADTGQGVDIPISHGTTSTNHAAVDAEGPKVTLSDLGSTNGTFHNEEAIGFQGTRDLRDGDKIRFGGYSVVFFDVASRS